MISTRKFEVLDSQKAELEKEFKTPVFIDIKREKLYIILESGETEDVF